MNKRTKERITNLERDVKYLKQKLCKHIRLEFERYNLINGFYSVHCLDCDGWWSYGDEFMWLKKREDYLKDQLAKIKQDMKMVEK